MRLLRFRLSSVLICFTVVALVLGYTQFRRRNLNNAVNELRAKGCLLRYSDHWFWPVVPVNAGVAFRKRSDGDYSLATIPFPRPEQRERFKSLSEAAVRFNALQEDLLELGVEEVFFFTEPTNGSHGEVLTASGLRAR